MEDTEVYTLADCVDEFLALRQIDKKKYYSSYLISSKFAWKELFKNTICAVNSEWKTLKKGVPYNYIDKPNDVVILFSVCTTDECGKIVPLYYNNTINTISKPSTKKCSCTECDCGGLCSDANSLSYTTKLLFTISGIGYYEKTWAKVCANGDVIEYKETPTKKYNDFTGDGGDYMNDYMGDYSIGAPAFSNFTIVPVKSQKTICKLTTKVCGCPENTQENCDLLNTLCGELLPFNSWCKKKHCNNFLGAINSNYKGEVKISECGTRINYIPHPHSKVLPEFLLVNYQTSGEKCSETVNVPDYAKLAMFSGIDFFSKRYNNSFSQVDKDSAKYAFRDAQNNLILDLNKLSLEWLSTVQDAPVLW